MQLKKSNSLYKNKYKTFIFEKVVFGTSSVLFSKSISRRFQPFGELEFVYLRCIIEVNYLGVKGLHILIKIEFKNACFVSKNVT